MNNTWRSKSWREWADEAQKLSQQLAAAQAQIKSLKDDGPGTPLGMMKKLFELAETECGHNPASAKPALVTVWEWVLKVKADHELP